MDYYFFWKDYTENTLKIKDSNVSQLQIIFPFFPLKDSATPISTSFFY